MILLVSEINLFNFPVYFIFSLIYKVKTYKISSFLYRVKGKIEVLDLSEYFSWENSSVISADAVIIWEKILENYSNAGWCVNIRNNKLDLAVSVKQSLQKDIEELVYLQHIYCFYISSGERVRIMNSLRFRFLSKIDKNQKLFKELDSNILSKTNIFLDCINFYCDNLFLFFKLIIQYVNGIILNEKKAIEVKYIYDGISPRELSIDGSRINFTWLIDDNLIKKKEILFMLPRADFQMKQYAKEYKKDRELLVANSLEILKYSSRKVLFCCFFEAICSFFKYILFAGFNLKHLLLAKHRIDTLKWLPIVESLHPKVYICTSSGIGKGSPAIVYFNAVGIKTIIWLYGTNSYLFTTKYKNCDFRNIGFSNVTYGNVIVWNQNSKEYIDMHPQNGVKIEIMGPLMSGDEAIVNLNKNDLCKKFNLLYTPALKYVAIFDSPEVSPGFKRIAVKCPDSNTEKYNFWFIRDMYNLLFDFENIMLVYKPKRSLTSGKFFYSDELKKIFENMRDNKRVIILDYNINPWLSIAVADMCISMPFESPSIACLHYNKPALFHDPENIALHHRYKEITALISHNYEELRLKVKELLFINSINDYVDIKNFQGDAPGENSSKKFREYLKSL